MQRTISIQEFLEAVRSGDTETVSAYLSVPENTTMGNAETIRQALNLAIVVGDQEMYRHITEEIMRPVQNGDEVRQPIDFNLMPSQPQPTSDFSMPHWQNIFERDDEHRHQSFGGFSYWQARPSPYDATHLLEALRRYEDAAFLMRLEDDVDDLYENTSANMTDSESPVRNFLRAARTNNREAVESYIYDNRNAPDFAVHLSSAAQVAEAEGHDDLAAYLSQLVTDLNSNEQGKSARLTAGAEEVKYNNNEVRLMAANFTGDVPNEICCHVTNVIFFDPVTVCTGITYERDVLDKLMSGCQFCKCPLTNLRIERSELNNASNVRLLLYVENFIRLQEDPKHNWDIASILKCPISTELIDDPVTVACGLTFDRSALRKLFLENGNPDEILWHGKYRIKFSEIDKTASNVSIKSMLADYRAALKKKEEAEKAAQQQADAMDISPQMNADQVRKSRLRVFDQPPLDKNPDDKNSLESPSKKNK